MAETDLLRGTSVKSFADAAEKAMGEATGPEAERFRVESLSIERGGVVGITQFHITLRREE